MNRLNWHGTAGKETFSGCDYIEDFSLRFLITYIQAIQSKGHEELSAVDKCIGIIDNYCAIGVHVVYIYSALHSSRHNIRHLNGISA